MYLLAYTLTQCEDEIVDISSIPLLKKSSGSSVQLRTNLNDRVPTTLGLEDARQLKTRVRCLYNFLPLRLTPLVRIEHL